MSEHKKIKSNRNLELSSGENGIMIVMNPGSATEKKFFLEDQVAENNDELLLSRAMSIMRKFFFQEKNENSK